jgi:phosphoenolpyruvate carboxylase
MIHPLNLLQVLAIQSKDFNLLRYTVTGISSGMLTTG